MAQIDGMRDHTIVINGMSKTYSVTGWRVGWALAPPEATQSIRKVHDFLTVGAAAPLQQAGALALKSPQSYYDTLASTYGNKRARLLGILENSGFTVYKPRGAYYIMTDIARFKFDENKYPAASRDVSFAKYLVEHDRRSLRPRLQLLQQRPGRRLAGALHLLQERGNTGRRRSPPRQSPRYRSELAAGLRTGRFA